MSIEALQDLVPEFAKDLRLNLSSLLRQSELSEQQLWGLMVCCALTTRSKPLTEALLPLGKERLSEAAFNAASSAAAIMGMKRRTAAGREQGRPGCENRVRVGGLAHQQFGQPAWQYGRLAPQSFEDR